MNNYAKLQKLLKTQYFYTNALNNLTINTNTYAQKKIQALEECTNTKRET